MDKQPLLIANTPRLAVCCWVLDLAWSLYRSHKPAGW
nr:hypothetical protein RP007_01037 [Rhizobium sp. P007]